MFSEFRDTVWDDPQWGSADTGDFIRQLNQPAAKKKLDGELPENRGFVFHAVVSAPPGDRLDHEVWGSVAQDYIRSMGFDGEGGKAGCRWAAFHHGQSSNDNDHVHIVVQMIREDGTWASNFRSLQRSQEARRAIEKKYGFISAEEAARQRDWPAYSMIDAQRATTVDREGKRVLAETEVERLRRLMLGAATQAASESDYVRALWRAGVLTRPRYAAGTTDVVVGYSVALRPEGGAAPFWHAAGKVHRSLTITNVRSRYVDSVEAALEASATWATYNAARSKVAQGEASPEATATRPAGGVSRQELEELLAGAAREVARFNTEVLPGLGDEGVRRAVARDVAGLIAVVAQRVEPAGRGPWMRTTDAVLREARGAKKGAGTVVPVHAGLARAARLIGQAGSRDGALGWSAVMEQLGRTVEALAEADIARRQLDEARYLRAHAGQVLGGLGAARQQTARPASERAAARGFPPRPGVGQDRSV